MRIIAGKWRSRRLERPASTDTRPFPDRVKEAVFSMLGHFFGEPSGLPAILVADVFSGGGTMGLEALSRGAARCTFFENGKSALKALRINLDKLSATGATDIFTGSAWAALAPWAEASTNLPSGPCRLFFLDPPYKDSVDVGETGAVHQLFANWHPAENQETIIVFHHPANVEHLPPAESNWKVYDRRNFGTNGITLLTGHEK